MRISDIQATSEITHCIFCKASLTRTSSLYFCDGDLEETHSNIRLNIRHDSNKIHGLHLELGELHSLTNYSIQFDFINKTTVIFHKGKSIQIDKIVDLDLFKITFEGVRDIIAFI